MSGHSPMPWPDGPAFDLPAAARESLAWALRELPQRQAETRREQFLILDAATGERLLLLEGDEESVELPEAEARRVGHGKPPLSLVLVHTHPDETSFSDCDMATFLYYTQLRASVLCSPGTSSTYWLGRDSDTELADYRYDGRSFASLDGSAREVSEELGVPADDLADGSGTCCVIGGRISLAAFSDRVSSRFIGRINALHGAGLSYVRLPDPDSEPPVPPARKCVTYPRIGTREAYETLAGNAAGRLTGILLLVTVLWLRACEQVPAAPAAALLPPLVLMAGLMALALSARLRLLAGGLLVASGTGLGSPRRMLARRRARLGRD